MSALKDGLKRLLGGVAARVSPALAAEVRAGDMSGPNARLKRWIAYADFRRLSQSGDGLEVQKALTSRWQDDNLPVAYYDKYKDRFDAMFEGGHNQIVAWLADLARNQEIAHVIEVGCGDGRALAAMADGVPDVPRWTGVDIHAGIIARNRETFAQDARLTFVAADATDWLASHVAPGTVLVTVGGVMEYIAPETLKRWFSTLASHDRNAVLLAEPVDADHDMARESGSRIHGAEDSFSHNHRALLESCGFAVTQQAETMMLGFRWMMMEARGPGST